MQPDFKTSVKVALVAGFFVLGVGYWVSQKSKKTEATGTASYRSIDSVPAANPPAEPAQAISWAKNIHSAKARTSHVSAGSQSEQISKVEPVAAVTAAPPPPPKPVKEVQKEVQAEVLTLTVEEAPAVAPSPPEAYSSPEALEPPPPTFKPYRVQGVDRSFWMWAGMGYNFTSMQQSLSNGSDVEFGGISGPSGMFKGGAWFSPALGMDLNYKNTPGEAKSSSTINVVDGKYKWKKLSAELLYRPQVAYTEDDSWHLRVGLQQDDLPFLLPVSVNKVKVNSASLTSATLGFEYKWRISPKLRGEWLLRGIRPLSAAANGSDDLSITPKFAGDVSIGASYEVCSHGRLGVYWYNQYQKFDFKYTQGGTSYTGDQTLILSNFDFRLGFEF